MLENASKYFMIYMLEITSKYFSGYICLIISCLVLSCVGFVRSMRYKIWVKMNAKFTNEIFLAAVADSVVGVVYTVLHQSCHFLAPSVFHYFQILYPRNDCFL